jgi:hypothetical protein
MVGFVSLSDQVRASETQNISLGIIKMAHSPNGKSTNDWGKLIFCQYVVPFGNLT